MAQQRRLSLSDDVRSGEEMQAKFIKSTSHNDEHAVQHSDQGIVHQDPPKKRKRVARACMSCQKSHMSCGDERPCSRCVDRGIAHTCCDGERKPRPTPSTASSSAKRAKVDETKYRPKSRATSSHPTAAANDAATAAVCYPVRGAPVLPFSPVPSAPPANPYASYYWQGTHNAPPTLEYHLTQEVHQQVAPHPHQHQHHVTLDHHHAESIYARPMQNAGYFLPQKISTPTSYLTPTDSPASSANTPDDSSTTATGRSYSSPDSGAATTALDTMGSSNPSRDTLPSAGSDHYDYYGGYTSAYALPSAVVSGRYWDAANPALAMDYSAAAPQSMYTMDFAYHQQAQLQHRSSLPAAQAQYAVPTRPVYGSDSRGLPSAGSIHSQLI